MTLNNDPILPQVPEHPFESTSSSQLSVTESISSCGLILAHNGPCYSGAEDGYLGELSRRSDPDPVILSLEAPLSVPFPEKLRDFCAYCRVKIRWIPKLPAKQSLQPGSVGILCLKERVRHVVFCSSRMLVVILDNRFQDMVEEDRRPFMLKFYFSTAPLSLLILGEAAAWSGTNN